MRHTLSPTRMNGWANQLCQTDCRFQKIHHAAFDAHLIGIDPDYRLHVSGHLLDQHDGPMLEALKQLDGGILHLPAQKKGLSGS